MKRSRIILTVIALLAVAAVLGLFVFLKTFDVNKSLPGITAQASQAIGRDLKVGSARIGFSFSRGITLQAMDIVLADDPAFSDKPFLTLARADVGLDVGALVFERRIKMAQVTFVAPRVVIIRSKEGLVNAATIGPKPSASPAASAGQGKPAVALPALLVNHIRVEDARVTYVDRTFTPPMAVEADRIDVNIRDLSLTAPFSVTLKAALFSSEQGLSADARVTLDMAGLSARVSPLNMQFDLAKIEAARLEKELPMLKDAGLKRIEGMFKLSFSDMQLGAQGLARLKGQAVLEKGLVTAGLLPVPAEDIQFKADLDEKNIRVASFSCRFSEGTLSGDAVVTDYSSDPGVAVAFDARAVNVRKIAEGYKLPLTMSGLVSSSGEIKFSGRSPEAVLSSLNGRVKEELKDGVLENMNLLAAGLGNIPMLPGLLDTVMAVLPAETQEEVKKGITRFDAFKAEAHMADGLVHVDALDVTTRDLGVHAAGTVTLAQQVSLNADIRLDKDLSQRLGEKVPELSYLKDAENRIYLPMKVTGPLAKPAFMPDVEYLTKKLVLAAGGEELQKALGGSEAAAEAVGAIFDLFRKK